VYVPSTFKAGIDTTFKARIPPSAKFRCMPRFRLTLFGIFRQKYTPNYDHYFEKICSGLPKNFSCLIQNLKKSSIIFSQL